MLSSGFSFQPQLLTSLKTYTRQDFLSDLIAGITVGVVALPLAMAFAIASGLKPEAGIFTAIIAGFIISAAGGSRVQIGGPAGAFIVVVYGIIAKYGVDGLIISTIMAGILLFIMGMLRLGSLVRFVPVPIIIGFTNGIAVLIALSQVKPLLGLKIDAMPSDFFPQLAAIATHLNTAHVPTIALSLASIGIVFAWPKLIAALNIKALQRLPGTIVALVCGTVLVSALQLDVATIGSAFGGIPSSLPSLTWPDMSFSQIQYLLAPTITIALLGAVESLLCARIADGLADDRHNPNQELMAQGLANIAAPLFGGYCATGTIARTATNIRTGARTPVAGIIHALVLLLIVLLAAPLAKDIPLATLGAILLFVAFNMGEWHEFIRMKHFAANYRLILMSTFILTIVLDLTVAVEVGLVLACLFFIARMSAITRLEPIPEMETAPHVTLGKDIEAYRLHGALFFGATHKLEELIEPGRAIPKVIVLDLRELLNMDASGVDTLKNVNKALQKKNCRLFISGARGQPLSLIERSGLYQDMGSDSFYETVPLALDHAQRLIGA